MASLLQGSLSGLAATGPMTVAMLTLRNRKPSLWLSSLPPRRITLRAARKTGLLPRLDGTTREASSWLAHFGFGAAAGAVYSRLPGRRAPPLWTGPLYGLAVWASAYLGLMPVLDLHPSAAKDRRSRTGLMVASHLVWGFALSLFLRLLARHSAPAAMREETSWSEDIEEDIW